MRGLSAAVTLLTRVPIGGAAWDRRDLDRSLRWVPLVGAVIGLVVALAYVGAVAVLPATVAAGVAVALGVLITGGLHEDGLADTADGWGGGSDRGERLAIMKDPRNGTYGALALVFSVVLRVTALATIRPASALVILPAVHALSRGGAIALVAVLSPASSDGLGAAHSGPGSRRQVAIGGLVSLLIGLAALGWWVVPFALVTAAGAGLIGLLAQRNIGGFTGDVLGAAQQVGEVSLLVLGAALTSPGLVEGAWWR